jgi:hypothetical protein
MARVVISVALQYGISARSLGKSIARIPENLDGPPIKPASPIGAARAGEKAKAGRPSNNPSDDARDSRGAPTILSEPGVILQSELWRPGGGRSIHTPLGVR